MGSGGSKMNSECDICCDCTASRLTYDPQGMLLDVRDQNFYHHKNEEKKGSHSSSVFSGHVKSINPMATAIQRRGGSNELDNDFNNCIESLISQTRYKTENPIGSSKITDEESKKNVKTTQKQLDLQKQSQRSNHLQNVRASESSHSSKRHKHKRPFWPSFLRNGLQLVIRSHHPSTKSCPTTSSASCSKATSSISGNFAENYAEFLPHNCQRCLSQKDMESLFEFERLEKECKSWLARRGFRKYKRLGASLMHG
ncbi:hypothetical protein Aperf_G00000112063 [Anoplocephala perfoliata]